MSVCLRGKEPQRGTQEAVEFWAKWVYNTIRLFGGEVTTAHFCAAHFAEGLEQEWKCGEAQKSEGRET